MPRADAVSAGTAPPALCPLSAPGFAGERRADLPPPPPGLLDPAEARRTLHWGRNYLWVAAWPGVGEVVIKQFRHESWRARRDRRRRGSKARRSFATARAMQAVGIRTPEPLLWADTPSAGGPAWYVSRFVESTEARYPYRALAAGTLERDFPELPAAALLAACAAAAAQLHAQGFWYRDLSAGNLLLHREGESLVAELVDLNRCRRRGRLGLSRRLRDLARLPVHRSGDQRQLLLAYFGGAPPLRAWPLYRLYHAAFHGRHRLKNALRRRRGLLALLRPRHAYPHLPPPPAAGSRRDKAVWDELSDQPHQHASARDKLLVRLQDFGPNARALGVAIAAAPRVVRRYRELMAGLHEAPVPFRGVGVALRPHGSDPQPLVAAIGALGVEHALIRLHPWEESADDEEALARALHARGIDLVFTLPQRRELVRDLPRWRAAVAVLGQRFAPFATAFQVGQAINRSKWGLWSLAEYRALLLAAAEALAPTGVPLAGPGVIDFEPHATMAAVNWPDLGVDFHALASLLYVDRRGGPEGRQLGFDALRKAALVRAIADTARWCEQRSWITEINWPLREGPHAPAGGDVAVDETTAADYLVRFYLPILASGLAERVYWWQLVARGYGLMVTEGSSLRPRPAFQALATMQRLLRGATCTGVLPAPANASLYRFTSAAGTDLIAGWSARGPQRAVLPWQPAHSITRDGGEQAEPSTRVLLDGSVRYFVRS